MNIKITIAAVLAIAGAAAAAPFSVSGTVDFGGPGNAGAPLTVGGGIISVPASPEYAGPGTTGIAIAADANGPSFPTLTAGSPGFSFTSFEGGYFMDDPVISGITPDGLDGVFIMGLSGDFSSVEVSSLFVTVTDADGTQTLEFTDVTLTAGRTAGLAYLWVTKDLDGGYALGLYDVVPSPASAGLLGLAGLAATRRRR